MRWRDASCCREVGSATRSIKVPGSRCGGSEIGAALLASSTGRIGESSQELSHAKTSRILAGYATQS